MTVIEFEEGLVWDIREKQLDTLRGARIPLSSQERRLFYLMVRSKIMGNRHLSYIEIIGYLSHPENPFNKDNLKSLIFKIRKKLERYNSTFDTIKIVKNKGIALNLTIKSIGYEKV